MLLLTSAPTAAVIGPNSVLQTLRSVREGEGTAVEAKLRVQAGLPAELPSSMIPERWFVSLIEVLRRELPERAEYHLEWAGRETAAYVAAHRIPAPARQLLARLPGRLALPLLLKGVRAHAWTFAGSGAFSIQRGPTLILRDAPTCRTSSGARCGGYYATAFEGLLRLADPRVRVREVACQAQGAPQCRFVIEPFSSA
ncbi:MAG: bacteriochlorophyll 4-vinyl reductase [Myxococcota bacterium]